MTQPSVSKNTQKLAILQILITTVWGASLILMQILDALGIVEGQGVQISTGSQNDVYFEIIVLLILEAAYFVITVGGVAMWMGRARPLALLGASLMCIPCISPGCCVGIPFGFWSIMAISRDQRNEALPE